MKAAPQRMRVVPLQIRLTEEEIKVFRNAAEASGLSLSAWVRDRMLRAAHNEIASQPLVTEVKRPRK